VTTILGHSTREILRIAARLRVDARRDRESQATATALRTPARRSLTLAQEAPSHETLICTIVREWHPELLELLGVGPIVAATVLCAWSHPGRCRSDAAFAMLAGAAPIPASLGQTSATGSTDAVTANLAGHCTPSPSAGCATTPTRAYAARGRARERPTARSNGASSATSPDSPTGHSRPRPQTTLDIHRSVDVFWAGSSSGAAANGSCVPQLLPDEEPAARY